MKNLRKLVIIIGLGTLMSCGGDDQDPPVCLTEDVTDYHLVIFRGSVSQMVGLVTARGGSVERVHENIGVAKVTGLTDEAAKKLRYYHSTIKAIARDIEIDWLRERVDEEAPTDDGSSTRKLDHNDPKGAVFYNNSIQWNMHQIQSGDAWDVEQGDENVRIAVIDTGISPDQTDLIGQYDLTASINFTHGNPTDLEDANGHGTQVSGVISTNNVFVAGLAPHTTMIGIKALQSDGSGNFADLIAGIMHAVDVADADIINISFGSHFSSNYYLCNELWTAISALKKAINYAHHSGVLVVAAAGDGDDMFMGMNLDSESSKLHFPSQFHHALSVGATASINRSDFDSLASYSNFGITAIDVVAPGGNDQRVNGTFLDGIMTTISPVLVNGSVNRYNMTSGTGIAAAHVSALAALISAQNNESLAPDEIRQQIISTSDDIGEPGPDDLYGNGRINALRAVTE